LDERLLLLQQIEEHARGVHDDSLVTRITPQIQLARQHIQRLRQIALAGENPGER
jgi:hypothetical protein